MGTRTYTATEFHESEVPVYDSPPAGAVFRKRSRMATVVYEPARPNPDAEPARRGHGRLTGTWIYSEEHGKREGLLRSSLELFMDSTLDPGATIGLHEHPDTEEIYYVLEGDVTVEVDLPHGERLVETLAPGDSHLVQPGQCHSVTAGPNGARFVVVAARVPR